jgi:thiamine pyrophosphokinase
VEEDICLRAHIFAAGEYHEKEFRSQNLPPEDVIIAADGGAVHLDRLGITPNAVVGDFDSLSAEKLQKLEKAGVEILRYPSRKDFTDLELALLHAKKLGIHEITIYGALGARWDQTLANLLLPAAPELDNVQIRLVDNHHEISLIRPQNTCVIRGEPGDTVSLIPISTDAQGITTQGLEYPLNNGTLLLGSTRGVSNVMVTPEATVTLTSGLLICVVIHMTTGMEKKP